ncbi:MAG: alpha/beta fold hydrolase [Propionicimonas sp.]|nr:alpha/beta fold hydrolase [Propionicimonas sp.]
MSDAAVRPGAEPFHASAGRHGVLLCHGFTGSPASMRPWAEHLAGQGYTVRVPRLPGHGTTWQEMNETTWRQWYAEVDAALSQLWSSCDWVAVCGMSMGGALALRLAEQRPADVGALVLVNPAVGLKRLDLKLLPVLRRFTASFPGISNDIRKAGQDEVAYDRVPLHAMASQLELWRDVRGGLARVTAPLLYFRSLTDHVVDDLSQSVVLSGVSSRVHRFVELPQSYHVATLDHDAPLIFERSAEFLAEQAPQG